MWSMPSMGCTKGMMCSSSDVRLPLAKPRYISVVICNAGSFSFTSLMRARTRASRTKMAGRRICDPQATKSRRADKALLAICAKNCCVHKLQPHSSASSLLFVSAALMSVTAPASTSAGKDGTTGKTAPLWFCLAGEPLEDSSKKLLDGTPGKSDCDPPTSEALVEESCGDPVDASSDMRLFSLESGEVSEVGLGGSEIATPAAATVGGAIAVGASGGTAADAPVAGPFRTLPCNPSSWTLEACKKTSSMVAALRP
mmetsp:Transcript_40290/g.94730  ORF Transcript_40290/g.94730 Transcript_40290/m.94730 type:complete len:256 (-) Transcript_40290:3449-4216(-)